MIDKRKFHYFLNTLKDDHGKYIDLIESVQEKFEEDFEAIKPAEKKALKQYPVQFVKRMELPEGEWNTKLHMWAEQAVPEILGLDPIYLAFKNSAGDSVLMSLVLGATGAYTEKMNYELIGNILNTDLTYEDIEKDEEGKDKIIMSNALDVKDLNNQTILDYLIDFAYGEGEFKGQEPDARLQEIINQFSDGKKSSEKPEKEPEVKDVPEEKPEVVEEEILEKEETEEKPAED